MSWADFRDVQPELRSLVDSAAYAYRPVALAEELFTERDEHDRFKQCVNTELAGLAEVLSEALSVNGKEK